MSDLNDQVQIQGFCLKYVNQVIDDNFGKDLSGNRGFIKELIKHKQDDSFLMTLGRLAIKNEVFNQFDDYIMGYPSVAFKNGKNYNPSIVLRFGEFGQLPAGRRYYQQLQISFKIFDSVVPNLDDTKIKNISKAIQQKFKTFEFKTGFIKVFYKDEKEKIQICAFVDNESIGKNIINTIFQIFGKEYNKKLLHISIPETKPEQGVRSIVSTVRFVRADFIDSTGHPKKIADRVWYLGK